MAALGAAVAAAGLAAASSVGAGGAVYINASVGVAPVGGPAVVPPVFDTLIFWDYSVFTDAAPDGTAAAYPFLSSVELFTATGGCYIGYPGCTSNRDCFMNPADPASGYDYQPLIDALDEVRESGFTPYVVTGMIPIALSAAPALGAFGFNTAPASNWSAYGDYITNFALQSAARFGPDVVAGWRWGVLTEFNNPDWYVNDTNQYFDLYDWTVCALQGVLGPNITVGAHACTQCTVAGGGSGWDPLALLNHTRYGTNACTGGVGTRITFLTDSFYERTPGTPGDLSWYAPQVGALRAGAIALGYGDLTFGIDEGRILAGTDGLPLLTRAVGSAYQASFDALLFKLMVYGGASTYARWGITSNGGGGLFTWQSDVDPVSTQVARLAHAMAGDALLAVTNTTAPGTSPGPAAVDATVSVSPAGTLHVLAVRHAPTVNDTTSDAAVVTVCGLTPGAGTLVGTATPVDETHANFWPAWQADAAAAGIDSYQSGWSPQCEQVALTNATQAAYFASRVPAYRALAALTPYPLVATLSPAGCATFSLAMVGHAVVLATFDGAVAAAAE